MSNINPRKTYEICSKLTIKTPFSVVYFLDIEQVNFNWECS